jgi:hypothetical protein
MNTSPTNRNQLLDPRSLRTVALPRHPLGRVVPAAA